MIQEISSFDFDGTLFFTPEPETGKDIFKRETGIDWPHVGWWSKKETLDTKIFHIPMNEWVYRKYLSSISDNKISILATGRMEHLRKEVENILDLSNLTFDKVYLNPGGDTYDFKIRVFENLIDKYRPLKFIMYDDRKEHLVKFKKWSLIQQCEVDVIDINTKTKI